MSPSFYLVKDSARPVFSQGQKFQFEAADYFEPTHSWWGVYRAVSAEEIAALDEAVVGGFVTEISEEDYEFYQLKKKTARASSNFINFGTRLSPQQSGNAPRPAVVVDDPPPRRAEVKVVADAESLEDALRARPVTEVKKLRK